jgi:hypothetical protein
MKVELLYFEDCPNYRPLLASLREILAEAGVRDEVTLRGITTVEEAEREHFLGSPTVRINANDVDPDASPRRDFGLKCRLYRAPAGTSGVPPRVWISTAIAEALASKTPLSSGHFPRSAISSVSHRATRRRLPEGPR